MKYEFPLIDHISDVLPAIKGADEFIVADRGEIQIVNYMVNKPDTFFTGNEEVDAIRRECRGLVFGTYGNLISRPYHKFFNVNENEEVSVITLQEIINQKHWFMEKLDGSMVRPIITSSGLKLATKMGFSDTAVRAQYWFETCALSDEYGAFMLQVLSDGFTPIFEWLSPQDRIVIDYGQSNLILTGLRNNFTGKYFDYLPMKSYGEDFGIPVVDANIASGNLQSILSDIRQEEDSEGYVIRFEGSGHMAKVKNEWYIQIHSAKELVTNDRLVVQAIFDENLDDLKSLLPREDLDRVNRMEQVVNENLLAYVRDIEMSSAPIISSGMSRKEFATNVRSPYKMFMFRYIFDGEKDLLTPVKAHFRKFLTRNVKFDTIRDILLEGM